MAGPPSSCGAIPTSLARPPRERPDHSASPSRPVILLDRGRGSVRWRERSPWGDTDEGERRHHQCEHDPRNGGIHRRIGRDRHERRRVPTGAGCHSVDRAAVRGSARDDLIGPGGSGSIPTEGARSRRARLRRPGRRSSRRRRGVRRPARRPATCDIARSPIDRGRRSCTGDGRRGSPRTRRW